MKTAISLPDDLFEAAEKLAGRMGMSRSRLYATALEDYVARHHARRVSERLNAVYSVENSNLDQSLHDAQAKVVSRSEW